MSYTVDGTQCTVYGTLMEYLTKTMRLDSEVIAWLDKLKATCGSYNKGLRTIALCEHQAQPAIEVHNDDLALLDAVGPELSSGRGEITTVTHRGPLLKPSQR